MSEKIELGKVLNLFISKNDELKTREEKHELILEYDGVCGDRFKGKDLKRSVFLVSTKSYEMAKEKNIDVPLGELGENILIDFDPYSFKDGTRLQIGDVVFEISQKSTLCNTLTKINNKLPKLLKNNRGIFAKVINEGKIIKNDKVFQIV